MSALGLSVLVANTVLAANPYLVQGKKLFDRMMYEEAEQALRLGREVPTSTLEESSETLDLLARCLVAEGKLEDARHVYVEELQRDPHAPNPLGAAPKIQTLFLQAKQQLYPPAFVQLRREPAGPSRLAFSWVDPWHGVRALQLHLQLLDGTTSEVVVQPTARSAQIDLPPGCRAWQARLVGSDDRVLALIEGEAAPAPSQPASVAASLTPPSPSPVATALRAEAPRSAPPPKLRWALAGSALVCAIVGTVLAGAAAGHYQTANADPSRARQEASAAAPLVLGGGALLGLAVVGGSASTALFLKN